MGNLSHVDNITPKSKWEFDEKVAQCFSDMLERSIPDYKTMRRLVFEIGAWYVQRDTWLVDVGCSTGLATEPFLKECGDSINYLLCDNSEAMIRECKRKFVCKPVAFSTKNFWELELPKRISLCLSILSIQFMPTTYRQKIINNIYDNLLSGGAFIFVEKVLDDNAKNSVLSDVYHQLKYENGYTHEQIRQKQKSLENVLSPLKASWNEDMLRTAGFKQIDMFWRCLNFCGWVAVK